MPCCIDVEFDSYGKVTWSVEMELLQLSRLFNLRWAGAKGDGSKAPIKSLIKIKDSRFVYKDAHYKLLVVVEETQPQALDKVVSSSGQSSETNSCSSKEVCHKFEGDSKSIRQH